MFFFVSKGICENNAIVQCKPDAFLILRPNGADGLMTPPLLFTAIYSALAANGKGYQ
jgi:hypothetical protein